MGTILWGSLDIGLKLSALSQNDEDVHDCTLEFHNVKFVALNLIR